MLRYPAGQGSAQLVLSGDGRRPASAWVSWTLTFSYPFYRQLQQKNAPLLSHTAAIFSMVMPFTAPSSAERRRAHERTVGLRHLTFHPRGSGSMGRVLNDADDSSEERHAVAVVSYSWWKHTLARDPAVLNRRFQICDAVFDIVGMASPEFLGSKVGEAPDIWVPTSMMKWFRQRGEDTKKIHPVPLPGRGTTQTRYLHRPSHSDVDLLLRQITRGFSDAELSQKNLDALARLISS